MHNAHVRLYQCLERHNEDLKEVRKTAEAWGRVKSQLDGKRQIRGEAALEAMQAKLAPAPPPRVVPAPLSAPAQTTEAPAPVMTGASGEWTPITSLTRAPGYRWPLYQFIKAAHIAGKPCPKPRDFLVWLKAYPEPELEAMSDGLKYNDGVGNPKEADLKAIQQAIKGLLQK
jgi:hypothetical protein